MLEREDREGGASSHELSAHRRGRPRGNGEHDDIRLLSIDAIHELTREHDRMVDRLTNLEQIYLDEARDYLAEHLEHADIGLLEQWIANEPSMQRAVQIGLRKIAGIAAKRRFVNEIRTQGVEPLIGQLGERRAKADGRTFYGCDRFPVCRFTTNERPTAAAARPSPGSTDPS